MFALLKKLAPLLVALGVIGVQAAPALACGGLVAPNGAIRLSRASTLISWHAGVEHYMTAFSYEGNVSSLGWIVPLPTVPDTIQEGGAWTFQRLGIETHPIQQNGDVRFAAAASTAQVIQQVEIAALNITVLKGSGQQVLDWCQQNGFTVNGDVRAHLIAYAQGSPIFMAVKYDTSRAQAQHLNSGDGTPLLITMRTPRIWVPLEVLANDGQQVQADLFFLTDMPLHTSDLQADIGESAVTDTVPGSTGLTVAYQERMNATLYHDLSTDRNMSWVRSDSWLTYLTLDAPDSAVNYDLGVSSRGVIRLAHFGTAPMMVGDGAHPNSLFAHLPHLPLGTPEIALAVVLILLACGLIVLGWRRYLRAPDNASPSNPRAW